MEGPDRYKGEPRGIYGNDVHTHMIDARPPSGGGGAGGPACSDPAFFRTHHMEKYGVKHAILIPRPFCSHLPDPDFGTGVAEAYNDWMADTWLGKDNPDGKLVITI
ncbi:hypothetical protein [Paenibacillus cremeus]|uniref:Amidohydrolase-related domain-containing protein n=1 Tax=Paenibacillus cremeus TaxID=2163881 RepID=A0A559JG17_9BACL|nr:hypothetical protein [Paenibacillus cremeus]TVX98824.1 hypothetical protein FPZ49_34330 [Paenibacillus cremeus]